MKVTLWGTRGSLATPGPESVRYGGNTCCVEVRGADGSVLVLDAGTGIRRLGDGLDPATKRVDILLTHLHMDHIQGLGFFGPMFDPDQQVHIWGPPSTTMDLRGRLARYLSPPLFPIGLRDVPCRLEFHDVVSLGQFQVGGFEILAALVCHPGPTVGYRITGDGASVTYLPDHEPALVATSLPQEPEWISGFELAVGVADSVPLATLASEVDARVVATSSAASAAASNTPVRSPPRAPRGRRSLIAVSFSLEFERRGEG